MSDEQNKNGNAKPLKWRDIPPFFLALAALIYATGFLIIFSFHDSYGLQGVDAAFFKIRYAHVGILFLMLPLIATCASYAWTHSSWRRGQGATNSPGHGRAFRRHIVVIGLLVGLTYYLFLMFAPPGASHRHHIWIPLLLALVVPLFGRYFALRMDKKGKVKRADTVRIFVVLFLAGFLSWAVSPLYALFIGEQSLQIAAVFFLFFVALMSHIIQILVGDAKGTKPGEGRRGHYALGVPILGLLYFMTILTFALGVFHYVPRSKGGGDYTQAGLVVLYFKENGESQVPGRIVEKGCAGGKHSIPLVMIEGTASSVFVADPEEKGGPTAWRRGREDRPNVIEIARDMIASVEHQRAKTDEPEATAR